MRTVIVYESLFGDTREIAEAIAGGVTQADPDGEVACVSVLEASLADVAQATFLIAGGPTQFFGMASRTKSGTWLREEDHASGRSRSGQALEPGVGGETLHEWLNHLPEATLGSKAAAFDTRLDNLLSGGAAGGIARRLRGRLYDVIAEPEGFVVEDMEGPLRDGELDRATAWGSRVAHEAKQASRTSRPRGRARRADSAASSPTSTGQPGTGHPSTGQPGTGHPSTDQPGPDQ